MSWNWGGWDNHLLLLLLWEVRVGDIRRFINPYVSDLLKFYNGLGLAEILLLVCTWRGEVSVLLFGREQEHSWVEKKKEGNFPEWRRQDICVSFLYFALLSCSKEKWMEQKDYQENPSPSGWGYRGVCLLEPAAQQIFHRPPLLWAIGPAQQLGIESRSKCI